MRIYIMTDLEGVAGVVNYDDWCDPSGKYYEKAKELLAMEVNAAVEGFYEAGASHIMVVDGHGVGGVNHLLLDPRVEYLRGLNSWPFGLDSRFDFVAWVGQHAKSGTQRAHIAHTSMFRVLDCSINGVSVGEFGQFAMCAAEIGVRCVFGSGDEAFTCEAQNLVPGIETAAVKRGLAEGTGDELNEQDYAAKNLAAVHLHPESARMKIREGARNALARAVNEDFGLVPISAPFERILKFRDDRQYVDSHPASIVSLLNIPIDHT